MKCEKIIKDRFISPLMNKKTGTIGVELEFPMLNMNKAPVEKAVALKLLNHFLNDGFTVEDTDTDGKPAFITNHFGDCISFDNSYNNIEFSMDYGDNLLEIGNRFYDYVQIANGFLQDYNYLITGMGTNPYKKHIEQSHVSYPVYNMVDEFLHTFNCENTHDYPDFPAYLSSVQTHLDINPEDLPKTATLFAKIDFLRGLLFSNSPDFEFSKTLCYRDYLWHKSAFGLCGKNTGAVDEEYQTLDDIAKSYYDRCMFNIIRNGKYEIFQPKKISQFFEHHSEADIKSFLSFRHMEITCRGTLEIRSDCTQPLSEALIPPAFNLGLTVNIDKAIETTTRFLKGHNLSNSYLRECVSTGKGIKELEEDKLISYALEMVDIAQEGLAKRSKNEEKLLLPLFDRAKMLRCPAQHILDNKNNLEQIIKEYATIKKA